MNVFIRLPVLSASAKVQLDPTKISTLTSKAFAPAGAYAYWLFQDRELVSDIATNVDISSSEEIVYKKNEIKVNLADNKGLKTSLSDKFSNTFTVTSVVRLNMSENSRDILCILGNITDVKINNVIHNNGGGFFTFHNKVYCGIRGFTNIIPSSVLQGDIDVYLAYSVDKLTKRYSFLATTLDGVELLSGDGVGPSIYAESETPIGLGTANFSGGGSGQGNAYFKELAIYNTYKTLDDLRSDYSLSKSRLLGT